MGEMMGHDPMMGNLTYLHVAMGSAITWEYMGMLHHYSHLAIMSVLTVTQILSMFGILGEINMMAWMYAEMLEMVIGLVLKLGWMYTYDMAYSINSDSTESSANQ